MKNQLSIIIVMVFLSACSTPKISGLWQVEKVQVGQEEMTPIARWMRFHPDGSQESGNGWYQHSFGSYQYDAKNGELAVVNKNGYRDENGPFVVDLKANTMSWTRQEEGQEVKVFLKKSAELPTSPADQLLGVWKMERILRNGRDAITDFSPDDNSYLFLRWDRVFIFENTPKGRQHGVFHTHGHRPEIELILKSQDKGSELLSYVVDQDKLSLTSRQGDNVTEMEFKRIDYFPE